MKSSDIPILLYHDIGNYNHPWAISPDLLESHLKYLHTHNYHPITIRELSFLLKIDGELPQNCVAITFDDARGGVYAHALPLLNRYGFKATLFVVSSWLTSPPPPLPPDSHYNHFMSIDQIRECLTHGWELGSHTHTHRSLPTLPPDELSLELLRSRAALHSTFDTSITSLAYPYGNYSLNILNQISANYSSALTAACGFDKSPYQLSRQLITSPITPSLFPKLLRPATLSLAMIVKDEEQFLPSALNSVSSLYDELVIVDTGSSDKTIDIARNFHAKVIQATWHDDFSDARNTSLDHCTGDWILVLDADETIALTDHPQIRAAISDFSIAGYCLPTRNYTHNTSLSYFTPTPSDPSARGFPGYVPSIKVRLFQNDPHYRFKGAVHEIVDTSLQHHGGRISTLGLPIHHYGEQKLSLQGESAPNTSNVPKRLHYHHLNIRKIRDDPTDEKALFDLAVQHKHLSDYPAALSTLLMLHQNNPASLSILNELGIIYIKLSDFKKAKETYHTIISRLTSPSAYLASSISTALNNSLPSTSQSGQLPDNHSSVSTSCSSLQSLNLTPVQLTYLSESYSALALIALKEQNPGLSAELFEKSLSINPSLLDTRINLGAVYEQLSKYSLAIAHLKYALALHPTNPRALYNLAVVYEKQGNLHLAASYYEQSLSAGYLKSEQPLSRLKEHLSSLERGGSIHNH